MRGARGVDGISKFGLEDLGVRVRPIVKKLS